MKVIVTGAEEHQGLAVIRGLGLRGVTVVACGSRRRSLGFRSRFASETYVYRSPFQSADDFVADITAIIATSGAGLVIPAVESTLAVLDEHRGAIESRCRLAAPPSEVLDLALDKWRTVSLAGRLGVPVPRTVYADGRDAILREAAALTYPLALKPRGGALYRGTRHRLDFKVCYAASHTELARILDSVPPGSAFPLIQEVAPGTGVCVAAVCDRGEPVALFPYARLREMPLSGGVSVVRQSIALDPRLRDWVTKLLGEMGWHGVAMVEFKHDRATDRYALMEVNGRFQASTALSLDAGLNLPYLVYCLYSGTPLPDQPGAYVTGVRERWLRGDLLALVDHLLGNRVWPPAPAPARRLPSRVGACWAFMKDFRPGMKYDDFKTDDWGPWPAGAWELVTALVQYRSW